MKFIKTALNKAFGNPKGRAISNGLCSVLWVAITFTSEGGLAAGVCAINAALFGSIAAMNLSDHFNETLHSTKDELIAAQESLIISQRKALETLLDNQELS